MKVGTSELAAIIGKSPQWVRQLTREGVLSQVSRGKYILGETIQAYYEHKTSENSPDNGLNYNREKTLLTKAKRKLEENKLQIMDGKLHQAEDVEEVMTAMLSNFRAQLLTIPSKLAPKMIGVKDINIASTLIRKDIYEALTELSNYDPEAFKPKDMEFVENDEDGNK